MNSDNEPCYNAISVRDGECVCNDEYTGRQCLELKVIPNNTCEFDSCFDLANNGICDQKCNNRNCDFDGGDCSAGVKDPWADCPAEFECDRLFDDGQCDEQCNTQECLYDGFDCKTPSSADTSGTNQEECVFEKYCAGHFGDGKCDESCNKAACGWDGGDCAADNNSGESYANQLELVVDVDILSKNITVKSANGGDTYTISYKQHIERILSIILEARVFIIQSEPTDELANYSFFSQSESGSRKKRAVQGGGRNTKITLGMECVGKSNCLGGYGPSYFGAKTARGGVNTPYFNILGVNQCSGENCQGKL